METDGTEQLKVPPKSPNNADYGVSQNKTDFEIGPSTVTLSEAKGLVYGATRCFAAAQHDSAGTHTDLPDNFVNGDH